MPKAKAKAAPRTGQHGDLIASFMRISARRGLRMKILRERSLVEGVWNGRRGWLAVAGVVWGLHGFNKARHRQESVLMREILRPGEHVIIRQAITQPTRRQRRKGAKAAGTRGPG